MKIIDLIMSGGRPGMTIKLRNEYGKYAIDTQSQGLEPLTWEPWLGTRGYALGKDGLVYPLNQSLNGPSLREP